MSTRVLQIRIDGRPPLGRILRQRLDEIPSKDQHAWIMRLLIAGLMEETNVPEPSSTPRDRPETEQVAVDPEPKTKAEELSNGGLAQLAGVIG